MDFSTVKPGGNHAAHPAYIDGITQVGGFAVNAKDTTDLNVEVFISHGWESLQVYEEMKTDRKYDIYVKMTSNSPEFHHGDTIVIDGSRPIGYFRGAAVRRVDRKTHRLVMSAFVNKDKNGAAAQKVTLPASKSRIDTSQKATPAVDKAPTNVSQKAAPPVLKAPIAKTIPPTNRKLDAVEPPIAVKVPVVTTPPVQAPTTEAKAKDTVPKSTTPAPKVVIQKSAPVPVIKAVKPAVKKVVENKKITGALEIVSEESGISTAELTDESTFADIGVDSLLSMVIGSRFREELDLELDADFKIFVDCPSVKQLKSFLANLLGDTAQEADGDEADEADEVAEDVEVEAVAVDEDPSASIEDTTTSEVLEAANGLATVTINSEESGNVVPAAEPTIFSPSSDAEPAQDLSEAVVMESAPKKDVVASAVPDSALVADALAIISEESGIAVDDLSDESNFADVGVDSLLSMVIGSRFREELGLDLDADFSIFVSCPTVKDLKAFLANSKDTSSGESSENNDGSSPNVTTPEESDGEIDEPADKCKPATSVILQGVPKAATKTVFLLPDGSGSASSYVQVPRLKGDLAVVGLNSPFVREPENMNCSSSGLINSYVNEITRRQPKGPYHLGGWSSGGAFAFACAEALIKQGEEVHSLIIIDSPLPQVMERLPVEFYEFCGQIGLFGEATPPDYLIPHFTRTVDVMLPYKATPLKTSRMPKVDIIWACNTVMDEKNALKIKKTHFMTKKRQEFGPDGWETVLPGAEFVLDRAIGANHFTMMQKDHVRQVSKLIERVVG